MLLALLLLLFLQLLGKIACADNLGHGCRVPLQTLGYEGADFLLVRAVFGILAGRDALRQPGGALEDIHKHDGRHNGPIVNAVCRKAAPLVKGEPDGLLSGKVWMPAVSPETGSDKATVKISLLVTGRDLASGLVFLLCGLED